MAVVLVGPTAVGKSSLAVALAQHYREAGRPAEVVNADSMLVYRGMDIGTAKPTADGARGWSAPPDRHPRRAPERHRGRVPGHGPAGDRRLRGPWRRADRRRRIGALHPRDRGRLPVSRHRPGVRARWEAELEELGPEGLHRRLAELDPGGGRTAPARQRPPGRPGARGHRADRAAVRGPAARRIATCCPGWSRSAWTSTDRVLDVRIEQRVEAMWRAGLVAEVRRLAERGLREGLTASRALGYRQVLQLPGRRDRPRNRRASRR